MSDIVTRPPAAEAAQTSLPSHRHSLVDLTAQLFEGHRVVPVDGRCVVLGEHGGRAAEHQHPVRQFERLRDVVGEDDGCRAGGVGQLRNVAAQAGRRDLVERREALVDQWAVAKRPYVEPIPGTVRATTVSCKGPARLGGGPAPPCSPPRVCS